MELVLPYIPWIAASFTLLGLAFVFSIIKHRLKTDARMLITGSITKSLLYFTLPIFASILLQQLYSTVDYLIVGKFIGSKGMAAMGLSTTIYMLVVSFAVSMSMGASIVIAKYFGAHKYDMVKEGVSTIFIATFFIGIALSLGSVFFIKEILRLMQTPTEIMIEAKQYMTVLFLGFPIIFLYNVVSAVFRGVGDSVTPLFYLLITTALNILLDILFVQGFNGGIMSVAVATIVSQFVALVMALIHFYNSKEDYLKFNIFKPTFNLKFLKESFHIGFPTGIQQSISSLAFLFINKTINTFGLTAATAYAAIGRVDPFVTLPAVCFASSIATFVSQNLGAKNIDRISLGVKSALKMVAIYSLVITPLVFIFRKNIALFLLGDAGDETINMLADWFFINSFGYTMLNVVWIFHGAMRGMGRGYIPFIISTVALWIFRLPLTTYLSETSLGVRGIWLAASITWFFHLVITLAMWYSSYWKKTRNAIIKRHLEG